MKLEMNAIHICLIAFVFFVQRKHKNMFVKKKKVTDNFKHLFQFKQVKLPWFTKIILPMISLYLLI